MDDWFFYSHIKQDNKFVETLANLDIVNLPWQPYGEPKTAMHDGKGYNDCFNMEVVQNDYFVSNTMMHNDFLELINFTDEKFPMQNMMRVFKLHKGTRFTPHFDNPKCAIIYHYHDPDPISFYNEKNEVIFSTKYKFALLNTSIKHGVESLSNDRVWFKISIHNYSYYQLRELLYNQNLLE